MESFNLEAAKAGNPIQFSNGVPCTFVGVRRNGWIAVEVGANNYLHSVKKYRLCMAPKKRTVWVNFGGGVSALYYDTKEDADAANPYSYNRIGGKAYPVEIEE